MTPRVLAYTVGFTEKGMSERARFREEDPEFGLGCVELEVPLKYPMETLNRPWVINMWNRSICRFYHQSWGENRVEGSCSLVEKQAT